MTQKPTVQLKKIIICIFKKEYQDSFGAFKVLGGCSRRRTSHPRIAHGQWYTEWSAEEVKWEQGRGPKRPMSCKAYFRPLGQFSMIFNGNYVFSTISCQFFILSKYNFAFFFIFCEFSMVSNGKFASCHFPMLFNGNLKIEKLWGRGGTYIRMDGWM